MTTPTRGEIYQKATELWFQDQHRSGCSELAQTNPEYSELAESGFVAAAQSMLMSRGNPNIVVIPEKEAEPKETSKGFSLDVDEAFKTGAYACGSSGVGKSDVAMNAVKQLPESTIVIVFDPSQDWQNRSSIPRYETLEDAYIDTIPQENIIYDISLLGTEQTQKIVENFCKRLLKQQAETPEDFRRQYFLVFEEGHEYFSEGALRAKRLENTAKIMTRDRNFKIRFMCITPFSSLIDKKAMKYMAQRFFGYTSEPNDIR